MKTEHRNWDIDPDGKRKVNIIAKMPNDHDSRDINKIDIVFFNT